MKANLVTLDTNRRAAGMRRPMIVSRTTFSYD
jgi:hypothetical protein